VFASCLKDDVRFEIIGRVTLGLVCFRLKVSSLSISIVEQQENIHDRHGNEKSKQTSDILFVDFVSRVVIN
jgi:hypothetical protein